ncbi:hypothetical protein FOCC_FOCC012973 [Frankliniella occidentalis]|nr:hypothetical protein FOCC_FOCC012973 [Frankliniella occidentalis]
MAKEANNLAEKAKRALIIAEKAAKAAQDAAVLVDATPKTSRPPKKRKASEDDDEDSAESLASDDKKELRYKWPSESQVKYTKPERRCPYCNYSNYVTIKLRHHIEDLHEHCVVEEGTRTMWNRVNSLSRNGTRVMAERRLIGILKANGIRSGVMEVGDGLQRGPCRGAHHNWGRDQAGLRLARHVEEPVEQNVKNKLTTQRSIVTRCFQRRRRPTKQQAGQAKPKRRARDRVSYSTLFPID